MMSEVGIVTSFYGALRRGDLTTVVARLNDTLTWTEGVGLPCYGSRWRTFRDVIDHLFVPLARDWDGFEATADWFVSEGDAVVALGVYSGLNRSTGRSFSAAFAHHWRVQGGRIVSFRQYTDTLLVQAALQERRTTQTTKSGPSSDRRLAFKDNHGRP